MDFEHQMEKEGVSGRGVGNPEHLKSALGSLNNLSEAGSIRICAMTGRSEEEEFSAWSLMSMVKDVTIVTSSEHAQTRMEICNGSKLAPIELQLLKDVSGGLEQGINPEKSTEGFGGTYFMPNAKGEKVAIFKPCDEEPFAPCNPKGFIGRALGDPGLKPTVPVGEAALREVAAYLLDHQSFAKIPTTLLTRTSHPAFNYLTKEASSSSSPLILDPQNLDFPVKLGSMQEFVSHLCDTTEMGTSKFTVSDVQRIAILDIRLYNTDRHAGNILVRRKTPNLHPQQFGETGYELVPIDHGFCLPEALEPPYFEWQHWSQARMPLGDQERAYIGNIDIEADKELLRRELPILREQSLRIMEISTTLLKRGVAAGLSLHEIAEIMTRPFVGMDKEKSELEKLCLEASDEIWTMSQAQSSDSEDSEFAEGTYSSRLDELIFKMDDWRDPEYLNGAHSPFFGTDRTQLEDALEQLSLDGGGCSSEASQQQQQHRTGLRSMSFALPTSSSCFQKRRSVIFAKQGLPHSNESPKEDRNRVVYPPLIQGSLPGSEDQVFRYLSDQQWPRFMVLLTQKIDEGLKNGKWMRCDLKKAASMSMNFGISCPRF